MVTKDLLHYIATAIQKHISPGVLESRLLQAGWGREDIQAATQFVKQRINRVRNLQILTVILAIGTLISTSAYLLLPGSVPSPGDQVGINNTQQRSLGIALDTPALYVAPNGNDDNTGTFSSPFATLVKARDAIRALGQDGITVYVRAGTYEITAPIVFNASDAGSLGNPNVYRNYPGEYPIFKGGKTITLPAGQSGTLSLDLSAYGLSGQTIYGMVRDGARETIARTPNAVTPNYTAGTDPWAGSFAYVSSSTPGNQTVIGYEDGSIVDPATWSSPANARVFVHTYYNWSQSRLPVASVNTTDDTITLATAADYAINYSVGSGEGAQRSYYYVENLPEFIDLPGEWAQSGNTINYQVSGTTSGTEQIDLLYTARPFTITDTSHLVFRNLSIEGAGRPSLTSQGGVFSLTNASHIEIDGVSINNSEDAGVQVVGGSEHVTVKNSRFTNSRGIGVNFTADGGNGGGMTFFKQLYDTNNLVENNYLYNLGFDEHGGGAGTAIIMSTPGGTVRHNHIENISSNGISSYIRNVNVTIESNYITKVNRQHRDGAGIYFSSFSNPGFQRSWIPRGAIIRNNVIDDTGGYGYSATDNEFVFRSGSTVSLASGIYLDDYVSGATVSNNILKNVTDMCFFIHGGRNNTIENNVCYGQTVTPGKSTLVLFSENSSGVVYGAQDAKWVEIQNMATDGYNMTAWNSAFPELSNVRQNPIEGQLMEYNIFRKNIVYVQDGASGLFADVGTGFPIWMMRLNDTNVFESNMYRPRAKESDDPGTIAYYGAHYFRAGGVLVSDDCVPDISNPNQCESKHYSFPSPVGTDLDWQDFGYDQNSLICGRNGVVCDSLFTNAGTGNFSLPTGSPALSLGIQTVDVSDTGNISVAPATSGVAASAGTVTVGESIGATWNTPTAGTYQTFRYRLATEGGSDVIGWQSAEAGIGSFSSSSLTPGSYKVCVAAQTDVRIPITGLASGWGTESCTSLFSVVSPPPGAPFSTPTPTLTPTSTTTPRPTARSTAPPRSNTPATGASSPTPTSESTGEPTAEATITPSLSPSLKPETVTRSSPTPYDEEIWEPEQAQKDTPAIPLKMGFGLFGIVNGLGVGLSSIFWWRAKREIP